jgi:tetratricopeptide (TPR) repeat protein
MDLPDDLKNRLRDAVVNYVAGLVEKVTGGNRFSKSIRQLSTQALFYNAFEDAAKKGIQRFVAEYTVNDEDLVEAIFSDGNFWDDKLVRQALLTMIEKPGSWLVGERESIVQHFVNVLPSRVNRERVDKAVTFLLRCILEELWALPGIGEIRAIYDLQFQKIEAEAARQQVALLEAQLQVTTQLSGDLREVLLQVARALEKQLLTASSSQITLPNVRPYHNLFQPDYTHFVGRQEELDWLRQRLSPGDRAWQIGIVGIGGVGKTALALVTAHHYCEHYHQLPNNERFEAIIWFSAKEEILTIKGREKCFLPGLIFHTLEDIYSTIAQTLGREDITRALAEEQDQLVHKALSMQRTLLVVDNIESVTDERIKIFLRNLPVPTKCIITSREWVDVTDIWKLTGFSPEEAEKMIIEEAKIRGVTINVQQKQKLFERTSGLPLPIKLSLARMASGESYDQVIRWLGNAAGDLPEFCIKGQIDLADHLNSNALVLLIASSFFDRNAGATRETLGYIANLSLADRDEGLTLLQRLSLLNRDGNDRFWILPIVQRYVNVAFTEADFSEVLTERWLNWLLEFTRNYSIDLDFHIERMQVVSTEYPNLLNAIRWCHEHGQFKVLLQIAEGARFYPHLVGLFGELLEILEVAINASRALNDEQSEGKFIRRLGLLYMVQGRNDDSLECLDKAVEIAQRYQDDGEIGRVNYIRSNILASLGHMQEAESLVKTIFEIGERLNDMEIKMLAAFRFSEFETEKLQFSKALEWLARGDKWSREIGWIRGLAWNMYNWGNTLIKQGNSSDAEDYLIQSLNMATSWSERRLMAYNEYCLARVYMDTGRIQLALRIAHEAQELCERLGMKGDLTKVEELIRKLPGI